MVIIDTEYLLRDVNDNDFIIDVFLISNMLGPNVNITDIVIDIVIVAGTMKPDGNSLPNPISSKSGKAKMNTDVQDLKNCLHNIKKYSILLPIYIL
jgi:hypothetical protein